VVIRHEAEVDMRKVRPLQQQQNHHTTKQGVQKAQRVEPYHAILKDRETLGTAKSQGKIKGERGSRSLTFLAAALKASLCEMSGLPALMRCISSLPSHSPQGRDREKRKKRKGKESVRLMKHERIIDTTLPLFAITD
jgi:hypothetical protein